ncbi:MAG: hypothetical protein QE272_11855 [Nevskia sp.]|nr:hypothetical protein [Nevskia sp.]
MATEIGVTQEIGLSDDAGDAVAAIDHRQRLDPAAAHQLPGVFQTVAELHADRIAAHHIAAAQPAEQPLIGVQFGLPQQVFQIIPADIEHRVVTRQRLVEVGGIKP